MPDASVRSQSPNATAQFLNQRIAATGGIGGSFWKLLYNSVSKFLPKSAESDLIDDHIQEFFQRLIARDAFAKRLAEGGRISDKDIVVFAIRSGFTDIRKWGTEPVTRTLLGARTERERENLAKAGERNEVTARAKRRTYNHQLVYDLDESDPRQKNHWDEVVDEDSQMTAEAAEDRIYFEQMWSRMQKVLRVKLGNPDLAERVAYKRFMLGCTVKELSQSEGILDSVSVGVTRDVRSALQRTPHLWATC
jgi:Ni,Fe-hydrogenase III large subunit